MGRATVETLKNDFAEVGYGFERKQGGGYLLRKKGSKKAESIANLKVAGNRLAAFKAEQNDSQAAEQAKVEEEQPKAKTEKEVQVDDDQDENLGLRQIDAIVEGSIESYFLPETTIDDEMVQQWAQQEFVPIAAIAEHFKDGLQSMFGTSQVNTEQLGMFLSLLGVSIYFDDSDYAIIGDNKSFVWDVLSFREDEGLDL
ncbi:MAG: hypothetical protein F6K14_10725 [Symploca sp. SIO2C1]|nr:hypothetical protein [Symploca sp. SIO2C1]